MPSWAERRTLKSQLEETIKRFVSMFWFSEEQLLSGQTEVLRDYRGFCLYLCRLICAADPEIVAERFEVELEEVFRETKRLQRWFGEDPARQIFLSMVMERLWFDGKKQEPEDVPDEWDDEDEEALREYWIEVDQIDLDDLD